MRDVVLVAQKSLPKIMMPSDQDYQAHPIFRELDRFVEFYKSLAHSVFTFVTMGTKSISNIDSYVFSSMQGTLTSMQAILRAGMISDAYALLRKYYDSAIITIYSNLYLEKHCSIENFFVQQIDNWLKGEERLPEYRVMSQYVRESPRVAPITELLFADDRYKQLRNRCNDHTHYNFYHTVLLNDPEIQVANRSTILDDFATDVRDVLILHAAYLFFAKQHYMGSSDYLDSLECGLTPEPDSQYWVAPFVQALFDEVIVQHRPDIAAIIKKHTNMDLK